MKLKKSYFYFVNHYIYIKFKLDIGNFLSIKYAFDSLFQFNINYANLTRKLNILLSIVGQIFIFAVQVRVRRQYLTDFQENLCNSRIRIKLN